MGGEDRELIGAVPFICNNCAEMQFFQCNVHGSVQCDAECRAFDIETVEMHDQCFRSKKQQQGISSSFSPVECSRIEFSPVQGLNSQFILFKHLQKNIQDVPADQNMRSLSFLVFLAPSFHLRGIFLGNAKD